MSFQPILPATGFLGWQFLQNTLEKQQDTFNKSAVLKRDVEYFRENIGKVRTAEDLVSDRRLLQVALGAFGLDEDINNRFFIRKILEEGTSDREALASRLADKRYAKLSDAFGFANPGLPRTGLAFFAETIIDRYQVKQFERAVGEQDDNLRAALNFENGFKEILADNKGNDARWFAALGNPPIRRVIEAALGLPQSIAGIDLDLQLEQFQSRTEATFGSRDISVLGDVEAREKLTRLFLVRSEADLFGGTSSGSVALSLLQSSQISYPSLF